MTEKFKRPTGTIFLRGVPRTIRDPFHAACAMRGKTMKEVILQMMKAYAKDTAQIKKNRTAKFGTRKKI